MPQRLIGHHRSEVGSADADVDDVANGLVGVPTPLAASDLRGEVDHAVKNLVDLVNDVDTINHQSRVAGETKGDMEDRSVL